MPFEGRRKGLVHTVCAYTRFMENFLVAIIHRIPLSGRYEQRILILYLREKGPMGNAPYIGSRLVDGPIFEVSLSQLDMKERPGKLPTRSSLFE